MARLLSVNVGLPRNIRWQDRIVHTAVWKAPVAGPCKVRRLNVDGDGQGDLDGHGGEQRAVLVYQVESYRFWQSELGRSDFAYGQFGENFTVDGLPDREVCIGDRYRIGDALFEVTQPRVTCYRVGIRMNEPRMASLLVAHGRPGFYMRVLEEGEVQAGDAIVQVAIGPGAMTVSDIDALLYMSGHSRDQLERALRIPALSLGWQDSFRALLTQEEAGATTGNAGLTPASGPPPAWSGFRQLKVARRIRESDAVVSLILEPTDESHLQTALPGQFVVLRIGVLPNAPSVMRSYSLSGKPGDRCYRVSVKQELHGEASTFLDNRVQAGDLLDVSAPRGNFVLTSDNRPIVLLSAGVGVTPVMAMLHALAARMSTQDVWWFHGARNGREHHPFAQEASDLLRALSHSHTHIRYSTPDRRDRLGVDFDAVGRLDILALKSLNVSRDADFYICGPSAFMSDISAGLAAWGVASARIHMELFGPESSNTPGIAETSHKSPHPPATLSSEGPLVSFARSGLNVRWNSQFQSLLELAEACDVPTRWSCRVGVCHNCETGLISGRVLYDPEPIDPPASANALICCSRPNGDIVLDI
ncbi:MOSC and FAD-binding oxidoreductase domain-containing protein [Mesorhizobium sp. CN2-181]|uniref:MOSC and FAD-binding oxidoreductase domain-containing protein n=1 Tax=Mesorhizobium yinganensis TaxID=3157707 RepID=UPI0032B7F49D